MRFPMTKVAEAKKIVEASPDRLFFAITEDAAFLQAMGDSAGIVSTTLDHRANYLQADRCRHRSPRSAMVTKTDGFLDATNHRLSQVC